jgi:acetyl esterase/lipase
MSMGTTSGGSSQPSQGGKAGQGGIGGILGGLIGDIDISSMINTISGANEDCLFIDVHVPGKAIRSEAKKLPVVNWIYGGAYLLGDKNYDGVAVVKASQNNIIVVEGNYRVGNSILFL